MNRYSLDSYQTAEDRMRTAGHIFDVGQIAPSVMSQLYAGVHLGLLKVSRDSWPIRGLNLLPDVPTRTTFELVRKDSMSSEQSRLTLWRAAYGQSMS